MAEYMEYPYDPEEEAWYEHQAEHGDCRYMQCKKDDFLDCPVQMILPCYRCGPNLFDLFDDTTAVKNYVEREGGIVQPHFDPTQTYILTCSHYVI